MTSAPTGDAPLRVAAAAAAAVAAAFYLATLSRTVGFIDRGELAAVAATLGIAHPTGYPLLTLLGHAVSRLAPANPVPALNALAALWVAAGVAVLVFLFARAGAGGRPEAPARAARAGRPTAAVVSPSSAAGAGWPRATFAAAAALGVAFSPIWWRQANGFEAYALHALLLPLVLLLYLRWVESEGGTSAPGHRPARRALAFTAVLGLSLANHMTTVLVAPALLVHSLFSVRPATLARRLPLLAGGVALGLLPYLYLPLRAAQHPPLAWGASETVQGFLAHVTAWQYRVWMFTRWETFRAQAGWFFTVLPGQLAWVGAAIGLAGAVRLAVALPRLAVFAALLFAATVLYASNYEIHDIESYYMLAMLAPGFALAAGFTSLAGRAGLRAAAVVALALVAGSAALHYRDCDESRNHLPHDYTRNLLAGLPAGAVVLSAQWDYFVSPALAAQSLEGVRPDVTVLDPELLRRSWYVRGLDRRAPDLAAGARAALDRFLREVGPFERGRPYDPLVVDAAYVGMVDALIDVARRSRPVLVTPDVDRRFAAGLARVPFGLALLLRPDAGYVPQEFPRWRFRPWPGPVDERAVTTHRLYAQALVTRAAYEEDHGRADLARRYGEYAATFDPRLDATRIPPLPLGGREIVLERIAFFQRIQDHLRLPPPSRDAAGQAPDRPIP
jgi:hypothetical protein